MSIPSWITMGKKKYGGMPFCERKDGSIMKETDPIARYICRQIDEYPTNPLDCYRNDYIIQRYQGFFNNVHKTVLTFGAESKKHRATALAETLPNWLTEMTPFVKEGWVVGDG